MYDCVEKGRETQKEVDDFQDIIAKRTRTPIPTQAPYPRQILPRSGESGWQMKHHFWCSWLTHTLTAVFLPFSRTGQRQETTSHAASPDATKTPIEMEPESAKERTALQSTHHKKVQTRAEHVDR
jgi:hypothetical protein